jgi:hypothetical protein
METKLETLETTAPVEKQVKRKYNCIPRWKPGESGNPAGRPKRKTFTELAYEYLGKPLVEGDPRTGMEMLVTAILMRAVKGDANSMRELLSRIDPIPSGNNITINNNLRTPILEALERLGVERFNGH